jgi:hypothetical protein
VTRLQESRREAAERAARHPGRDAREEAESGSGWYSWVARSGLVAKGVSFGIVGVLAIKAAVGDGGEATSRQGALQACRTTRSGRSCSSCWPSWVSVPSSDAQSWSYSYWSGER